MCQKRWKLSHYLQMTLNLWYGSSTKTYSFANGTRFGTPRALISDEGSHFCNKQIEFDLEKYSVRHRITTTHHQQARG